MPSKKTKDKKNKKNKKKTKKNNKIDPRSIRINNNLNKVSELYSKFLMEEDKRIELDKMFKKIFKKYDKIKAGAHSEKSLTIANKLYASIIQQDKATILTYLSILDSEDYTKESIDELDDKIREKNILKENLSNKLFISKFRKEKESDNELYKAKLRSILITDDIVAGGENDTDKDTKKAVEKIKSIYKKSFKDSGFLKKAATTLVLNSTKLRTAEERALNLNIFFVNSIEATTKSNKEKNIEIVADKEMADKEMADKGKKDPNLDNVQRDSIPDNSVVAAADVVNEVASGDPCIVKGNGEAKVKEIAKKYPLCIDKGMLYENISTLVGLLIGPLATGAAVLAPGTSDAEHTMDWMSQKHHDLYSGHAGT
ncbi:MAG: hypothetical protein CMK44_01485 [Porticoccus sp.]|nr:hypothetical protein [Porticoccus sp.]